MGLRLSSFHRTDHSYYPYQEEALLHIVGSRLSLLVLPVGLGKTMVSLSMYSYVKEKYPDVGCLFVTKKSVIPQIPQEVAKFFNGVSCSNLYEDTAAYRKFQYTDFANKGSDILVISYENLRMDLTSITDMMKARTVFLILDEATVFKNESSAIHKSLGYVVPLATRVVALSGTPVMNRLEDLYNILKTLGVPIWSRSSFHRDFCVWETLEIWKKPPGMTKAQKMKIPRVSGYKNLDFFYSSMKPFMFSRKKSEIHNMPGFVVMKYSLSETDAVLGSLKVIYSEGGKKTPYSKVSIATTCPQVILGLPQVVSPKMSQVLDILNELEDGEKCLVYSPYVTSLKTFRSVLLENGYTEGDISMVIGDTTDRQEEVKRFQETGKVFLMSDAANMGTDGLQVAGHIVFLDLPISAGVFLQTCGRISRVGSVASTLVVHVPMIRHGIDEDLWRILQNQFILQEKLTPDVLEPGLRDPEYKGGDISTPDAAAAWIRGRIENRSARYAPPEKPENTF